MNKNQKTTIEKILNGKEKEILAEFLNHFLDRGFGSVSKSETDIYLFHLLQKYERENSLNLTNFEWSTFLKISERKIKNLRLEVGIRYDSDDDRDELNSWIKLLRLITEGYLEFKGKTEVILIIENPYLLRFLESKTKEMRLATGDYSFNPEKVTFKIKSIEKLLEKAAKEISIGKGETIAEDIFKLAKWKNYSKETFKDLKSLLSKAFPHFIKYLIFPTS
jgi:hypothetical protein